jgi:hypothetical protein
MKKSEVGLHLLSSIFKLVTMSIRDWLSALKHIEAPKILSWEISKSEICMEFFKLGTWCKYFVVYANYNWEDEVLPVFGHQKMDKERNL